MKNILTTLHIFTQTHFVFLGVVLTLGFWAVFPYSAAAQAQGDGVYFYGIQSDTMPYTKTYVNSTNTFSATSTTVASGTAVVSVIKASPKRNELVAGYITSAGVLNIVCYDGTTWSNEWSVNVGGAGTGATTTRRFDIGYETDNGDVMVLYSGNVGTTNELHYRTKAGSTGCGSGNWSGATNLDPVRTSGTVWWVKIAEDRRATSTLMTAIWADSNADLSAMVWSGTAWGNENTVPLTMALEQIAAAGDTESFDVEYESLSGDVMVAWGSGGTNGTNGAFYAECTGGTSTCTWGATTSMPTFLDDASHISMAADPLSDRIVFASIGNAGSDLQNGIWSGTAWTNQANADTGAQAPVARRMFVATGWLNNNGHKRPVVAYYQNAATNIGWRTATGTTWTTETDFTPSTTFGTQTHYDIEINPFNNSELIFTVANSGRQGFAKRLAMASDGSRSWTDSDGGVLAGGINATSTDFAYLRYIPPPELSGVLYSDYGATNAGAGKTINLYVGTSTPSIFSTTTTAGGVWRFTESVFSSATSGTPFILWLDGDAADAVTIMAGYSGLGATNVPLFYYYVISHAFSDTATVGESTFAYDTNDDGDIMFELVEPGFVAINAPFIINKGIFSAPRFFSIGADFVNNATFDANDGAVAIFSGSVFGNFTATSSFGSLIAVENIAFDTTNASATNITIEPAATLTAPSGGLTIGGFFENNGTFSHNNGTVYADSYIGEIVAGLDVTGAFDGTGNETINDILVHEGYVYVTVDGNATQCSQLYGDAIGCELQIYRITENGNLLYVAGRDGDGDVDGIEVDAAAALAIKDNILFFGKVGAGTACNSSVGAASGCELIVFDITNPKDPIFLSAMDHDGSKTGSSPGNVFTSLSISGNYLYTTKYNDGTACSQVAGSARGCELQVFDISSSTNLVYRAGRDADGSSNGTGFSTMYGSTVAGNYLYIARHGQVDVCSDTPGSAIGCELQIYDISSSTNPIYVAGYDAGGLSNGDTGNEFYDVKVVGNTLYVSGYGANFDCSSNIYSCELQVFNVTDPTNPSLVNVRDASGAIAAFASAPITNLEVRGDYLYAFKLGNATACGQTVGTGEGCEMMVFDISSTTNPTYVAGRDVTGSADGTGNRNLNVGSVNGNYIYAAGAGSATTCSENSINLIGCEIVGFSASPQFLGPLTGESRLNNLVVSKAGVVLNDDVETADDLNIRAGLVEAPVGTLTIGGDYTNTGRFDANGGTVKLSSFGGVATGTMTGTSAFNNLRVGGAGRGEVFSVAVDTSESYIYSLAVSGEWGVMFAGSGTGGVIYRCDLTTGCDASGDFTTAYDTTESSLRAMVIDEERRVLYVGAGANGIIYRCDLTTGCDAAGDFTIGYDTTETTIRSMVIDYTNDVLYVGTETGGIIYRCDLTTGCDASGDFTTAYDTTQSEIRSLAITRDNILFAGSGSGGIIYRCDLTTGCDASGDFTTAYDTSENYIHAFAVDTVNDVLYAGNGFDGSIYRCDMSTGCDASGDFTNVAAATFSAANVHSMVADNNNGIIYAGTGASGNLYRCDTFTGCDQDADWSEVHSIASTDIYSLAIDEVSGALYAGSYSDGRIIRRAGGPVLTSPASTTNTFIQAGKTLVSSSTVLEVSGNFANNGVFTERGGLLSIVNDSNPFISFAAGRDSSGLSSGSDGEVVFAYATYGDYLYVGKSADSTSCAQNPSSAQGCELLVYNISDPLNPVFVQGIDASASTIGTGASTIRDMVVHPDGYLIVAHDWNSTACSQTPGSAIGCELKIYDITDPSAPAFMVARDTNGTSNGTGGTGFDGSIKRLILSPDNTVLYVGKEGSGAACSQTPGSAAGCELMVYNLADINDPVYIAGFDGSGSAAGTADQVVGSLAVSNNHLYVGKEGDYTACTQTPGSAEGCELLVFDISSTTNPTFATSLDVSGSVDGTDGYFGFNVMESYNNTHLFVGLGIDYGNCVEGSTYDCEIAVFDVTNPIAPTLVRGFSLDGANIGGDNDQVRSLAIQDELLFIGKTDDSSACLQSAGNHRGCEIQIYSIANPENPVFVVGQDVSGGLAGTGSQAVWALQPSGNTLYAGLDFNTTACSQTPGSAAGCETQVYSLSIKGLVSGNLQESSALGDVQLSGTIKLFDNASTTDFSIVSGTTTTPTALTVSGNYSNSGVVDFGSTDTLYFAGSSAQSISGTLRGTSALPDVTFLGVGTKTFGSTASTSDVAIQSGTTVATTHPLDVAGQFTNSGTFTTDDTLAVYEVSNTGALTFGSESTIQGSLYNSGTVTAGTGNMEFEGYLSEFLAGLDYDGSPTGTTSGSVYDAAVSGNILYVVKAGSRSACTQTAGGALGCELMVFDISDPTTPVFLAARDVSGGSTGSNATNAMYTLAVSGNYLYVGLWGNATACSQTPGSAEGCELQVYDVSSSTNPVFVAGRDVDGSTTGANSAYIYALAIDGNYLYVGSEAEGGACGQTPGNGYDCSLKVFNISSSTNPIYVAGRDVDGSNGSGGATAYDPIYELEISGDYLYVAKDFSSVSCSQTPGSAEGCELQVWDISSSTNPIFEAGRDINGSGSGTSSNFEAFDALLVHLDYLYAGHWGNTTACSQTPGSAEGCELQVYDISDPTDPTYVAGRDGDGSTNGTTAAGINSIARMGEYLVVGKFTDTTPCSQTPGSAEGCELQVYDLTGSGPLLVGGRDSDATIAGESSGMINSINVVGNHAYVAKSAPDGDTFACSVAPADCEIGIYAIAPELSGNLTGGNSLSNVTLSGIGAAFRDPVGAQDLTISTTATLIASSTLFVSGDFTQNGTFMTNSAEVAEWVEIDPQVDSLSRWKSVTYGNGLYVAVGSTFDRVMTSPDGINWTARSAAGDDDNWSSVTYGNGLFVAVGGDGDNRVMTSPDGINWTAQSVLGNDDGWNSVVYAEDLDLFVAVGQGSGNRVMTSSDGINWTAQTDDGGSDNWQSVTYGNGLFVAVGLFFGDRVMTSPDGVNWTGQDVTANLQGVTYGNGLYVAVGEGFAMTSPDGINWTQHDATGNDDVWESVTYGNGLYVAAGYSGDRIMTSPDGVNWTARTAAGDNDRWTHVSYVNGRFIAVGENVTKIMMSRESFPISFTGTTAQVISGSLTGANQLPSVVFTGAGTKTFTVNASTTDFSVMSTSATVTAPSVLSVQGSFSNEGTFVGDDAVYLKGKYNNTATMTVPTTLTLHGGKQIMSGDMTDTSAFTNLVVAGTERKTVVSNASTTNLTINTGAEFEIPEYFSVIGNYTNNGTSTSKGANWTAPTGTGGDNWRAVTFGDELFVAVGEGGARVMTSSDGVNWTPQSSVAEEDDSWQSVTYGNGLFVAVANSGDDRVMTSTDGTTWITRSAAEDDDDWSGVTYGNGLFVAVSQYTDDTVMTSPDGINWTGRSAAGDNDTWSSVTYGNGLFVAVGGEGDNRVMTSPDGINWTGRSAAGNDDGWSDVTYGDGIFVAVGGGLDDYIMTSPDGINWTERTTAGSADNLQGVTYGNGLFVIVAIYIGDRVMVSTEATTEFSGTSAQTASGGMSGAHAFGILRVTNDIATTSFTSAVTADQLQLTTPGSIVAFAAGATSTFNTVTITGTDGNEVVLRSTTPDTQFGFAITDTYSINYVDVKDSSGTSSTGVIQATGIDSGNNTNWSFGGGLTLQSAAPYHFYVGQATTTLGAITITETTSPSITAVNDILLHIDTTATNFRFNQGTANYSYGGSAAGKVATGVFYEEAGATVRLDVLEDFAAEDTLVINGVTVGGFTTATTATSRFELHTDDTTSGEPAAVDTEQIRITGSLLIGDHTLGQVDNQFSFQNRDDETLFAFSLAGNTEQATVTDMVLTLSGVNNLDTTDLIDFRLYRDNDSDRVLDGGDTLIDGSGILTINGQYGAVTFSQDFVASTSAQYLIVADTVSIPLGASAVFSLQSNGITNTGNLSLYSLVPLITVDTIQHIRNSGGAGGANSRAGGNTVPGAGEQTGGESGAGGGAGQEADGENIAADPDFYRPTTTGSPNNEWTNGSNALLSDGTYATAASGGLRQAFAGFGFGIPGGNTIQGIAVKIDASGSTAAGTLDISISWDGGNSFTTVKATPTLSGTDVVYTVGGNSDLWGRSWSTGEFSTENFRLRVTGNPSSNTLRLDGLEVRVYHQAGGGGSGGGGGGGRS